MTNLSSCKVLWSTYVYDNLLLVVKHMLKCECVGHSLNCRARLGYHLVVGPLFWECPHPWAFNPTLIPSADIHPFFLGEERVLWTHTLLPLSLFLSLAWRLNPLILLMWWVIRFTATIHFFLSFLIWASWPWWVGLWWEEEEEEEGEEALSPFVTGFCLLFALC